MQLDKIPRRHVGDYLERILPKRLASGIQNHDLPYYLGQVLICRKLIFS